MGETESNGSREESLRPAMPLTVLVVDDEEAIRVTLRDDLEEVGHQVVALGNGQEALDALSDRRFDVVISDLRMPGADGMAVLKAARERSDSTEVILITAYGILTQKITSAF